MLLKKVTIIATISAWMAFSSCNSSTKKNKENSDNGNQSQPIDSVKLLSVNLKKYFPDFVLVVDTIVANKFQSVKEVKLDTNNCNSFKTQRDFLGKLSNVVAVCKGKNSTSYLQTGTLKLWVCNIEQLKTSPEDTIIISGLVFNILGDEKTVGFPTILTSVFNKHP